MSISFLPISSIKRRRPKDIKGLSVEMLPPNSLNYSNEHSRVNITGIVQRGSHPSGQLEARISWIGFRSPVVGWAAGGTPSVLSCYFVQGTSTQTGIGCLQNLCLRLDFKTNSPPCPGKTDTKHWSRPVVWLEERSRPGNKPLFRRSLIWPSCSSGNLSRFISIQTPNSYP